MLRHQDPIRLAIGIGATIALLVVAAVSVFSVRKYSTASSPSLIAAHDRSQELERCRTIAPEQYASDDACRRAWAEQRRRFFGLDRNKPVITNVPTSPSPLSEPPTETTNKRHAPHPTLARPKD
jgi:conjugative transfer region protein TrbK